MQIPCWNILGSVFHKHTGPLTEATEAHFEVWSFNWKKKKFFFKFFKFFFFQSFKFFFQIFQFFFKFSKFSFQIRSATLQYEEIESCGESKSYDEESESSDEENEFCDEGKWTLHFGFESYDGDIEILCLNSNFAFQKWACVASVPLLDWLSNTQTWPMILTLTLEEIIILHHKSFNMWCYVLMSGWLLIYLL